MAQSAQNQQNAQSAYSATNAGLADYENRLKQFAATNPYRAGGSYTRALGVKEADAANAGTNAMNASVQGDIARTGANTGAAQNIIAEAQREKTRGLAAQGATDAADAINKDTAFRGNVMQMSQYSPEIQSRLFSGGVSGATGAGGNAASAAKTPGFWDTFLPALAGAAGQVGSAAVAGG